MGVETVALVFAVSSSDSIDAQCRVSMWSAVAVGFLSALLPVQIAAWSVLTDTRLIDFGPGYRVYYTQRGDRLLLLLVGGDKSTQQKDIERAIELARGFQE